MNDKNIITVKTVALSKTYGSTSGVPVTAVVDVDIEVRQSEVLLISGPNGSGKTTLLSMLGCLLKPSSGSLKIIGKEITALNQKKLTTFRLQYIGFIFQAFRLLDALTAIENVELVLNLAGIRRPDSHKRAKSMLGEMDISHRANFLPKALSGGEKQRIAIARALITDPVLLLADEPTGSLDSRAGQKAVQLLCESARRRNKTVIIVSHDERIEHFAQRVLRMEDGHITEQKSL